MSLTIIGDVHGKYTQYARICKKYPYTLQLGDLGFEYSALKVNTEKHRFFPGNHDNYDTYESYGGNIGDFGCDLHGGVNFFFVRGAFSIDVLFRQAHLQQTGQKTWWANEELSFSEMMSCYNLYTTVKPRTVITHTAPTSIIQEIGDESIMEKFGWGGGYTSKTAELLEAMLEAWQPKLWVFGHFHQKWEMKTESTKFICVPELGTYTIDDK